eukprot:comp24216_c0_seq1/m.44544 comp24216_c0_seq1/g.44544  ORF comp24216_c0_seq1/g.44544 comp24216_c0_seq1/m.44544 type:complete len:324 (+) comp24216_c0_seq1:2036-3007(+)
MGAAAILVTASHTAMRAAAPGDRIERGVRSPMAMASPLKVRSYPLAVTATSATGTCHLPTICSRAISPVMERSPMVMRKDLEATAGNLRTLAKASVGSILPASRVGPRLGRAVLTFLSILGGLPNRTDEGRSMGLLLNSVSSTTMLSVCVAVPTTAKGQRSRSQNLAKTSISFGRMASTNLSCDSLHHISIGDSPGSAEGTFLMWNDPPRPPSCTNSGRALLRPPAPTSWMNSMGDDAPMATHASITSWHLRCISGLPRCTEAKSRSAVLPPASMLEAAPPPSPISMAGPPNTTRCAPGDMGPLLINCSRMLPSPPASMIGLL